MKKSLTFSRVCLLLMVGFLALIYWRASQPKFKEVVVYTTNTYFHSLVFDGKEQGEWRTEIIVTTNYVPTSVLVLKK